MEFSRRSFSKVALVGATELAAYGHMLPPAADLVSERAAWFMKRRERLDLANALKDWTLPSGAKMAEIAPEILKSVDVLEKSSLREYHPKAQEPIRIKYVDRIGQRSAAANLAPMAIFADPGEVYIKATLPGAQSFEIPFLESLRPQISLLHPLRGTYAGLAAVAKEAITWAELADYSKIVMQTLTDQGARYELVNPKRVPVQPGEVAMAVTLTQASMEKGNNIFPWTENFIDQAAFFRLGGILYANWVTNYPQERSRVPQSFDEAGNQYAGFLQQQGLLTQSRNTFRWAKGRAPAIDLSNPEVLDLVRRF